MSQQQQFHIERTPSGAPLLYRNGVPYAGGCVPSQAELAFWQEIQRLRATVAAQERYGAEVLRQHDCLYRQVHTPGRN